MAARRPFWKWHRWKSIGFCLWPPSTCIWNLKLKFQSKLELCSGNHVVYRQTNGQTDKVNPVYPPSNFVGRGYKNPSTPRECHRRGATKCKVHPAVKYAEAWRYMSTICRNYFQFCTNSNFHFLREVENKPLEMVKTTAVEYGSTNYLVWKEISRLTTLW